MIAHRRGRVCVAESEKLRSRICLRFFCDLCVCGKAHMLVAEVTNLWSQFRCEGVPADTCLLCLGFFSVIAHARTFPLAVLCVFLSLSARVHERQKQAIGGHGSCDGDCSDMRVELKESVVMGGSFGDCAAHSCPFQRHGIRCQDCSRGACVFAWDCAHTHMCVAKATTSWSRYRLRRQSDVA